MGRQDERMEYMNTWKFTELEYTRPDLVSYQKDLQGLTDQAAHAAGAQEVIDAILQADAMGRIALGK